MKPFDIEKAKAGAKVVTRDGRDVEILKFDLQDEYPIVVVITPKCDVQWIETYTLDGKCFFSGDDDTESHDDLMMAPEKKSITKWFNIIKYTDRYCEVTDYPSKAEAELMAGHNTVVVAQPVTFEWEE